MAAREEGEEDGMMDGMVGVINNPFVYHGFRNFNDRVFNDEDVQYGFYAYESFHEYDCEKFRRFCRKLPIRSLKNLLAFLG